MTHDDAHLNVLTESKDDRYNPDPLYTGSPLDELTPVI